MSTLYTPLSFPSGPSMKNRFMLAPLTNLQSHADGTLSDEELHWLTMRAQGGFGLTMTCASHVQRNGQGFPGQLGIFDDAHIPGLTRLTQAIRAHDSLSICQLYHGGKRVLTEVTGQAMSASEDPEADARAMTGTEVRQLVQDFVGAAVRAERAGFDGVELHGAHGYLLCQFFSSEDNRREDAWGGSLENRYRILFEIVDGIREACGPDFLLGVRLSPERFGMKLEETVWACERLCDEGRIDFLDLSLWDVFKEPNEEDKQGRSLLSWFTEIPRGEVRLGVAGKIRTPEQVRQVLGAGVDWIMLGRAAILDHDFPHQMALDPDFEPTALPVSRADLARGGLSEAFIDYMGRWRGFVAEE